MKFDRLITDQCCVWVLVFKFHGNFMQFWAAAMTTNFKQVEKDELLDPIMASLKHPKTSHWTQPMAEGVTNGDSGIFYATLIEL